MHVPLGDEVGGGAWQVLSRFNVNGRVILGRRGRGRGGRGESEWGQRGGGVRAEVEGHGGGASSGDSKKKVEGMRG